jgi:hypothetical protein
VTVSDLRLPNFIGHLSSAVLRDAMETGDGFATFECGSEASFLEAAQEYGVLMHHRDSDDRGITYLRDVPRSGTERGLGFTNDALLPHTDRPAIPAPPRVLLLWCRSGSTEGGEATVLRGSDVADRLGELDPEALKAFCAADAAIFRTGADEWVGPVFQMLDGVLKQVRLRFDPHVYFAVAAALTMPSLLRALQDTERVFQLAPGTGYAVRNDRWLHGRRAFTGNREMLRIMIGSRHPVHIDA